MSKEAIFQDDRKLFFEEKIGKINMSFELGTIATQIFLLQSWHLRSNVIILNLKAYLTKY